MSGAFEWDPEEIGRAMAVLRERLGDKFLEAAQAAVEYAKQLSPVDTSNNKKSITMDYYSGGNLLASAGEFSSAGGNPGIKDGFRIYTQSGYGGWLEVGTSRMSPRPHIGPGFDRSVRELLTGLEDFA